MASRTRVRRFILLLPPLALADSPSTSEKALLLARSQALELKKEYTARVKTRADSQREVNDLLQRKSTWNSADVLRYAFSAHSARHLPL
jgi:hypothetical protein